MVHGSPRRVNEYLFEDRPEGSLLRMMARAEADVMLFGHTHKPYHKVLEVGAAGEKRYCHAVNTGSVGKPKDGDPRACYALLTLEPDTHSSDSEIVRVKFVRVPYDVTRAAKAIEESPLPDAYARALLAAT
jgi:diadenosine tetraphosphatase ApaH/serine/threonine PP2A family protein phosphatase